MNPPELPETHFVDAAGLEPDLGSIGVLAERDDEILRADRGDRRSGRHASFCTPLTDGRNMAVVNFPPAHAASTVTPPRARRPVNSPSAQARGTAGSR